jgi:drug/metabolite transporter (DMT)-like permease
MDAGPTRKTWLPYALLTLTVLFWSGNFVLGRGIRMVIPPVSLNFWRWVGALLILLPFGLPRIRSQHILFRQSWMLIALLSIPAVTIFNAFIYTALRVTTTTNTVLVNAMVPIFIAILLWLFFKEPLGFRQSAGVAVLATLSFSRGDLWTLGAGVSWAIYSVLLRYRPLNMDPVAFLTALVFFGLLFLLPFYLWELAAEGGFRLTPVSLASIAYVSLFPSVLSYIFWNFSVARVGANRAGIFFHLMPVFSILLARLLLGEQLSIYHLGGMVFIFSGIAMTTMPARKG